jgi:hypothetical protein
MVFQSLHESPRAAEHCPVVCVPLMGCVKPGLHL